MYMIIFRLIFSGPDFGSGRPSAAAGGRLDVPPESREERDEAGYRYLYIYIYTHTYIHTHIYVYIYIERER